ncbi:MAG: FAD-binding oxidoreductase [Gemmatimonadota bacterium]|nr:FAD-binding oxidoreductase [Gemmatimonadota bacterium]
MIDAGVARAGDAEGPAVVYPASVEEAAEVIRAANRTGTRLIPAGLGSWLGAGGWTGPADVIVSCERLNAVQHYEPADLTMTAGAGLGMAELDDVLRPNGQWLPVDAPGVGAGTVGGMVACGVSGALQGRYGAVRDNVLGVDVVTGAGRVLRIGGRVVKNVAGYDLVRLFTGSRGSLGIITSVSVRLFPRPEADVTLCYGGGTTEIVALARTMCTSPLPIAAVEVEAGGENGETVMVRLLGSVGEVEEVLSRLVDSVGPKPRAIVRGDESAALHRDRGAWEEGSALVVRLAALPDRLADTFGRGAALAGALGGEIAADAMSGVVRVKASPDAGRDGDVVRELSRAREEMEAAGGTMTLSQARGEVAARVGWTGGRGSDGGLGTRIKELFDPASILAARCP